MSIFYGESLATTHYIAIHKIINMYYLNNSHVTKYTRE